MKIVKTEDAVGMVLCHDITEIVREVKKGPAFRKGHIVTEEDIPHLLDLGKKNLYVLENDGTLLHEDEAAEILREITQGANLRASKPVEGKITLTSEIDGLFVSDIERLKTLNMMDKISIAARLSGFTVKKGDACAGMRVIPLMIEKTLMEEVKKRAGSSPIFTVLPFKKIKFGVVTTGSEVYSGRIKDTFTDVIVDKLASFGSEMAMHSLADDDEEMIAGKIKEMADNNMDMIICTGGMSVDPDDRTPTAIRKAGAEIISYGSPVLPGAMFLVSYLSDGRPVLGLPGCVMYSKRTVFDIVLPWLLAGIKVTKDRIAGLGNGGLCLTCPDCNFPECTFGKGV